MMDCGNLIMLIDTLHGREICFKSKQLEMLKIKLMKKIVDLAFLKHCRDSNMLPCFSKFTHHLRSVFNQHIFLRASLSLLKSIIQSTRREINHLNAKLFPLRLELASTLHPDLWIRLDTSSYARAVGR